jgi:hypothetical protein
VGYGFGHRISIGSMPIVSESPAPVPTIWKVAIFGAGTTTSDGEYVWDGISLINGKPQYQYLSGVNSIYFAGGEWFIEDTIFEENSYKSADLITWEQENGALPVPSSALSYSQGSYIQTVVLAGGEPDQSGTYTWDGTTFVNGRPKYFGPLKSGAPENNYIYWNTENYMLYGFKVDEMINLSYSTDLASYWSISDALVEPTVSSIVYTA